MAKGKYELRQMLAVGLLTRAQCLVKLQALLMSEAEALEWIQGARLKDFTKEQLTQQAKVLCLAKASPEHQAEARMAAEQARAAAMHAAQEAEAKAQRERDASVDAIWDAMNAARFKMVDMFRRMDTDGSGQLEKDELAAALRKLGMQVSDDVLDRVFGMLDVDNDGGVEVSEFLERMRAVSTRRAHARAQCSAPRLTGACAQAGSLPQREPRGPGKKLWSRRRWNTAAANRAPPSTAWTPR